MVASSRLRSSRSAPRRLHIFADPLTETQPLGFPLRRLRAFTARFVVRLHQIDVADAERGGEMKEGHDGRVAPSAFEVADILLGEARDLGEMLLGEAFLPPQSPEIPADKLAHIHVRKLRLTYYEVYPL